ncbi:MAG: hypothetical protein ACI4RG_08390 [Huintestinicola sp.]
MNSAAAAIINRQNIEKKRMITRIVYIISGIILFAGMLLFFIGNMPDILSENTNATHIHRSYDIDGNAGIVQDLLDIPLFLFIILALIAEAFHEYKSISVFSQYKVYKGVIGKICRSTEFKKPVFCVEVLLPNNTNALFNYLADDSEGSELTSETEIILIDFIRVKDNIVNPRNVRRRRYASNKIRNNKYIILRSESQRSLKF